MFLKWYGVMLVGVGDSGSPESGGFAAAIVPLPSANSGRPCLRCKAQLSRYTAERPGEFPQEGSTRARFQIVQLAGNNKFIIVGYTDIFKTPFICLQTQTLSDSINV